ncbi:hypothetical protein C8R45DRAFT_1091956 [Mycena sanguinolenta]|nr:hypothetical protein C8R45DRAFT_1091956 [Mycena sanguinolenta]
MPSIFQFEDVVENIVDEVFLDKIDEDGAYGNERLPKNFLKLALVSRNFLRPVRRNLYSNVRIEGTERFLLLTGQLRFTPHLSIFVKTASISSIGADNRERRCIAMVSRRMSAVDGAKVSGGDFLYALASQMPHTIKLTDISIVGCSRCSTTDSFSCTEALTGGWLKNIVAFPRLKELDITRIPIGGPGATRGIPNSSSVCTGLSISNMNQCTYADGLKTLLRSMSALAELVLDGVTLIPHGQLKNCVSIVAGTLTLLTINDYYSTEDKPQPWEDDTIADLHQLKTLCLNGVPVTPTLLDMLPPRLKHLRLSRTALTRLPAPILAAWLRRRRFPLRGVLKKIEVIGELRRDSVKRGPKASAKQVAELSGLCGALGIEWIYKPNIFSDFF